MIKLTTPEGIAYLRKELITAICQKKQSQVLTNVWIMGQDEPFNIIEDIDYVYGLVEPKRPEVQDIKQ